MKIIDRGFDYFGIFGLKDSCKIREEINKKAPEILNLFPKDDSSYYKEVYNFLEKR